jgi:hypothetical protein
VMARPDLALAQRKGRSGGVDARSTTQTWK